MSDLSLRAYQRKIENLIEENKVERQLSQTAFLIRGISQRSSILAVFIQSPASKAGF